MPNKKIYNGPRGGLYTLTMTGNKQYISPPGHGAMSKKKHKKTAYCGQAGGAAENSFPVNTEKRCRAALSYSRFAPRPCGVARCALKEASKHGWKCGTSSKRVKTCSYR